jgi:hypothetical protein
MYNFKMNNIPLDFIESLLLFALGLYDEEPSQDRVMEELL